MYATLRNRLQSWIFQLPGPRSGVVVLVHRRVFILPTRHGVVYAGLLMMMLLGSINYSLGVGFILAFLLAALGVSAKIHTYRNLVNLRLSAARAHPVFAGGTAQFPVCIDNPGELERCSVGITADGRHTVFVDVPARGMVTAHIPVAAHRRGLLRPGRLTLFTRYPLGLFRAWSYFEPEAHCVVYPRPAAAGLPLPRSETAAAEGMLHGEGREDFAGLRQYHPGDPPRHIAWKAAARGETLLTKQFGGRADTELWFDWRQLPAHLDVEERLSRLARWVLDAHALGMGFGLRLPGKTVPLSSGDLQRERCLEALALFDADESADGGSGDRTA
jgi:uncharacterized protein (DUF58 family)